MIYEAFKKNHLRVLPPFPEDKTVKSVLDSEQLQLSTSKALSTEEGQPMSTEPVPISCSSLIPKPKFVLYLGIPRDRIQSMGRTDGTHDHPYAKPVWPI